MSEYQYYEFQALDRPLSSEDQDYIRTLSSRVEPTATRAEFIYHYGDFRGNPEEVLDRCFDMMIYVANFGIRRLMIRFPKNLVNPESWKAYCIEGGVEIETTQKSIILNIEISGESYHGWLNEQGYLAGLISLRDDLMKGDLRMLYLAWLAAGYSEGIRVEWEELIEPPVPANLKKLSGALRAFVDLFEINVDLITAAAESSDSATPQTEPIADWIAAIPESERNAYLLRVIQGETHIGAELLLRLRQEFGQPATQLNETARRTFPQLVELAEEKKAIRKRKEQQAAEKAKQKRIAELEPKANAVWEEIDRLIESSKPKLYDQAIVHLKNLKELAEHQRKLAEFRDRVSTLKRRYKNRSALISRMQSAGL